MVLFRGDIKSKSLQRRTSISVILPADNVHFLQDREEIVPQPYKTLYFLRIDFIVIVPNLGIVKIKE